MATTGRVARVDAGGRGAADRKATEIETDMESVYQNTIKLIDFTGNFAGKLGPNPGDFGTTAGRVAEYVTTRDRWLLAREIAAAEATRTSGNIALATEARRTLVNSTRALVREIQAWPQMTDAKRRELRITVPDRTRTPVPAPVDVPEVDLVQAVRHTVRLRVRNPEGSRRRPAGTAGANIFYAVSATMPATPVDWKWAGLWTRGDFDVTFPLDTPAGSAVWVTAAYANPRGENGPMADAVTTNLPGGQAVRRAA